MAKFSTSFMGEPTVISLVIAQRPLVKNLGATPRFLQRIASYTIKNQSAMGFCEFVRALLNFGDCPRRNGYFTIFLPCFYEGAFVLAGKEGKLPLLPKAGCASSLPLGASAKKKAVAWGNSLLC